LWRRAGRALQQYCSVGIRLSCSRSHGRRCHILLQGSRYIRRTHRIQVYSSTLHTHTPRHKLEQLLIKCMPQRELVLCRAHLPLPVHDHGHRTVTFHSHRDHIHGPGVLPIPPTGSRFIVPPVLRFCIAERSIGTGPLFSEKSGGLIHTV